MSCEKCIKQANLLKIVIEDKTKEIKMLRETNQKLINKMKALSQSFKTMSKLATSVSIDSSDDDISEFEDESSDDDVKRRRLGPLTFKVVGKDS